MTRLYAISIKSGKKSPQIADNVLKDFKCAISEPSSWLSPGQTLERGLTFLNKNGSMMDSFLFKHQAYFQKLADREATEEMEIEELIYATIIEHYHIVRAEIQVQVTGISKD